MTYDTNELVNASNAKGFETKRLSNEAVMRNVCMTAWTIEQEATSLQHYLEMVIDHEIWKGNSKSFAEFIFRTDSKGLGIKSNRMLYLVYSSLDVEGRDEDRWLEIVDYLNKKMARVVETSCSLQRQEKMIVLKELVAPYLITYVHKKPR